MNVTTLNMTTLDGNVVIKKGEGGGGATINNQDKVVDITENGTTEVVADGGYTGLGKVTINTEVSGGGSADLEGEYFLAKPNGRYWKFSFATEDPSQGFLWTKPQNLTYEQRDAMCFFIDQYKEFAYTTLTNGDYHTVTNAKLDNVSNFTPVLAGMALGGVLAALANNIITEDFCVINAFQECNAKIPDYITEEFGISGEFDLIQYVKTVEGLFGEELTDDDVLIFLKDMCMIEPFTKEEYDFTANFKI